MGTLNRDQILRLLRTHSANLKARFGVVDLVLFGSFARDEATEHSDVDILRKVRFAA